LTHSIEAIRTEGLGDSTYVLLSAGVAIVVDPQRDIDRFERVLEDSGADLRLVLETHVHNDYVSGGRDLARLFDAELVMPAGSAPVFRHRPAFHHEDIDLGIMRVRPIHTPGHTPEHTSYVVVIEDVEVAVFSGGSLLVGSAGRSDLLGQERAETLARLQYGSVNRLASLPEHVELFPTHGAGSFCTTSGASSLSSTIGAERITNPVLAYDDEDSFVKGQLTGLGPYPSYYRHMAPANLAGLPPPQLEVGVLASIPGDVTLVDARPRWEFAAGHVPDALGIELRDSFGTWVGWLTEHNSPLALVLDEDQDTGEAVRQLIRIGYDDVRGVVRPTQPGSGESFRLVDTAEFAEAVAAGAQVIDVRAPDEWEEGVVDGAVLCHLPDLARETPVALDASRPVWVLCGTGFRSSIAGGILESRGFEPVVLWDAGATDVLRHASKRG
jgi:glyoxylase-like metal-dependent hydrolase (beta-lactamase superfamily II)/rhodanese-related sulfurtransferase